MDIFEMLQIVREKRYVLNNRAMYFYRRAKVAEERLNHWDAKVMLEEADYAACLSPPNYPVPALPIQVYYHPVGERIAYVTIHDYINVCRTYWSDGVITVERRNERQST